MKWYKVWTSDLSAPVLLLKAESLKEAIRKAKEESPSYDQGEEYKSANKCRFFTKNKQTEWRQPLIGKPYPVTVTVDYCKPHNSSCTCKGVKADCDFYPEVRKK